MAKNLRQYFPLVWERNEILSEIGRKKELEEKEVQLSGYKKRVYHCFV